MQKDQNSALARLSIDLINAQKFLCTVSVIKPKFRFCPFLWMFCSRWLNNLLNQTYKRTLRLIYNDIVSYFKDIFEISNEKRINK